MRPSSREIRPANKRTEGAIAVVVALTMIMLLGFAGLAIDVGNIFRVRNELQNAADAAALAGSRYLDGTLAGISNARTKAQEVGNNNLADYTPVVILDAHIHFGKWHHERVGVMPDNPEYPFEDFGDDLIGRTAREVTALRVETLRTADWGGPVRHLFAGILGNVQSDQRKVAIGVGGGPADGCGFPMVVGRCTMQTTSPHCGSELCLNMQNDKDDNVGWTSFTSNSGNPAIATAIENACFVDGQPNLDSNGMCANNCTNSRVDQSIQIKNGNGVFNNDSLDHPCGLIMRILVRGDDLTAPAQPFYVKVPVIGDPDGSCPDKFSGDKLIYGYAVWEIGGASCKNGGSILAEGWSGSCGAPPSGKHLVGRLVCPAKIDDSSGGGEYYGYSAKRRLGL